VELKQELGEIGGAVMPLRQAVRHESITDDESKRQRRPSPRDSGRGQQLLSGKIHDSVEMPLAERRLHRESLLASRMIVHAQVARATNKTMASKRDVPAIRIWPMSDQIEGFRGRSIEDVQRNVFLKRLPRTMKGRWRYGSSGLNADPGTIVLFQFKARIIALATFLRDERYEKPIRGNAGEIAIDPKSIRTFDPLDVEAMRKIWHNFRGFGHAKQRLNPTLYAAFRKRLKRVEAPSST
jgi:hypothetical protein